MIFSGPGRGPIEESTLIYKNMNLFTVPPTGYDFHESLWLSLLNFMHLAMDSKTVSNCKSLRWLISNNHDHIFYICLYFLLLTHQLTSSYIECKWTNGKYFSSNVIFTANCPSIQSWGYIHGQIGDITVWCWYRDGMCTYGTIITHPNWSQKLSMPKSNFIWGFWAMKCRSLPDGYSPSNCCALEGYVMVWADAAIQQY